MRIKLDIPLTLKELASYTDGHLLDKENSFFQYISTDTRELICGDLFIPLSGKRYDGEDYINEALNIGAKCISAKNTSASVLVRNTREALLNLAKRYKSIIKPRKTVAITGSVGKTTTKDLLSYITAYKYTVHSTQGNLNNELGVPFTVLSAAKGTEILIIEAGMNTPGELRQLSECITPDICIITNIGTAHIGNFGSREMIAHSKSQIADYLTEDGVILIPENEPLLSSLKRAETVSTEEINASYCLKETEKRNGVRSFNFHSKDNIITDIICNIPGEHIPSCLSFAIAVTLLLGMKEDEIRGGINNIPDKLSRHAVLETEKYTIIDDCYNSSPEAVALSLKSLLLYKSKGKSIVLGDMNELGQYTEELHRYVGKLCANADIDYLFTFGAYSEFIADEAAKSGMSTDRILKNSDIMSPQITANQILSRCNKGDVILFKASHAIQLNRVIDILKKHV